MGRGADFRPSQRKALDDGSICLYIKIVVIIVPEPKRIANLAKHGIDMNDFAGGFSWDRHLSGPTRPSLTGRLRERLVGTLNGRVVIVIVSPLGSDALSVVSIRPASVKERAAYAEQA